MKYVLLLFVLVLLASPIAGQDEPPEGCDYTALADQLTIAGESLIDSEDPSVVLQEIAAAISATTAACSDLSFSSEANGMQPVIGPFTIPAGIYRLTAVTDGALITSYTVVSGECDDSDLRDSRFILYPDEASEGVQSLLNLESDCEVLMNIENVREPWTIVFEKLG